MKVGILTSGISQDLNHALAVIAKDGFSYAHIQFAWDIEEGLHEDWQEEKITRLLKQYHIRQTAILHNFFSGLTLKDTEVNYSQYQNALQLLDKTMTLAQKRGCLKTRINSFDKQNVLFGFGGAQKHITGDNWAWKKYLRLMEPVCQLAEDRDVEVIIETGTGGVIHTATLAALAVRSLGSSRLKVLWDPANCLYSDETPLLDGYAQLRDHLSEVHIKDLCFNKKLAQITYCPLGQGAMAPYLRPLAEELKRSGFSGGIILENQVSGEDGNEESGYRQSVDYFRRVFCE